MYPDPRRRRPRFEYPGSAGAGPRQGTWNVRAMNQGKLEVVKQETARVIIDILGWTGMGEFNSDDHYIYYCGQESLRRNGVAIMVKKESKMQ